MNQTQIRYLLAFGWGVYAGVVGGYLAGKRKYKKVADEEIDSVKEMYSRRYKDGDYATPTAAAEKLKVDELIRTGEYNLGVVDDSYSEHVRSKADMEANLSIVDAEEMDEIAIETVDPEDLEANVSFEVDDKSSGPRLTKYKPTVVEDPTIPYVISVEEFMSDEGGYDKGTLVYYDGDDVLADERGQVVRNIRECVGEEFLTKFGDRSDDKYVVYVRNERLGMDFEVALDENSYVQAVHGKNHKTPRGVRFTEDD